MPLPTMGPRTHFLSVEEGSFLPSFHPSFLVASFVLHLLVHRERTLAIPQSPAEIGTTGRFVVGYSRTGCLVLYTHERARRAAAPADPKPTVRKCEKTRLVFSSLPVYQIPSCPRASPAATAFVALSSPSGPQRTPPPPAVLILVLSIIR